MRKLVRISAVLFVFIVTVSFSYAADISGTYSAAGTNAGNKGGYSGTVTIMKTGETYAVKWNIAQSGQVYYGTGILNGSIFAVAYTDKAKQWFGLISYTVSANGDTLKGKWCGHKDKVLGSETLTKQL